MSFTRGARRFLTLGLLGLSSVSLAQSTTLGVVSLNSNTSNPEAAWIGRGLADMLTTDLSKISKLTVVQREQLDKVLNEQALGASGAVDPSKAAQLGKVLGAQTLLTGSYAAIGRNVRVDLQLVNAATGRVEGGVTAEGSIDSIFSLEKQLVLAVLGKLGVTPSASEMQALLQPETFNNHAVELNYRGIEAMKADPTTALRLLQQASALDPNYASARKNLQIVQQVNGVSVANTAILAVDLAKNEMDAAQRAAKIMLNAVRVDHFNFDGNPKVTSTAGDVASLNISYTLSVVPGTATVVAKLLQPFSREGGDRRRFVLRAPGIGRNDQLELYLSEEALKFLSDYLYAHTIFTAAFSSGPNPLLIMTGESPISIFSDNSRTVGDQFIDETKSLSGRRYLENLPVALIRNWQTVRAVPGMNFETYSGISTGDKSYLSDLDLTIDKYEYLPIDAKNAQELNVPVGYLRSSGWRKNTRACIAFRSQANELIERDLRASSCIIYTKINDADFTLERLKDYLYRGESYTVEYYDIANRNTVRRPSRPLFASIEDARFKVGGREVVESILVLRAMQYNFFVPSSNPKNIEIEPLF